MIFVFFLGFKMGMGCPFHCSGDRAISTLPTSKGMPDKELTPSRQKLIDKSQPHHTASQDHVDDNEFEDEHLNLKTLATAVKVLTSPPVSRFSIPLARIRFF